MRSESQKVPGRRLSLARLSVLAGSIVACGNTVAHDGKAVPLPGDLAASVVNPLAISEGGAGLPMGANDLRLDALAPSDVYLTSFSASFQYEGSYAHTVYLYQPEESAAVLRFTLQSAIAGTTSSDDASVFRNVQLLRNPGQQDESEQELTATASGDGYEATTRAKGWYALKFSYQAPGTNRTLTYRGVDANGAPIKTAWIAPSGKTAQFRATFRVDRPTHVYFKGGAFSGASIQQFAFTDNIKVDGELLYRRSFNQGLFNYPMGYLPSDTHSLDFDFTAWSGAPSQSWFGVSSVSFDPKQREAAEGAVAPAGETNAKTQWDPVQFVYQGPMHTGDYDAWSEGVAFAQSQTPAGSGGSGTFPRLGVRPPPVRRGTTFSIALEHEKLAGPESNATLELSLLDSNTSLNWPVTSAPSLDYSGGIFTEAGFSTRSREHWSITVPVHAPIGRYVLRAFAPDRTPIGSDVLFYVLHNPHTYVGTEGLTKAEVETYGYDEDEDGLGWNLVEGAGQDADQDHLRDQYVVVVGHPGNAEDGALLPGESYGANAAYSAAFRRTSGRASWDHSLLDYAMASAHGATSEFETMVRLLRFVSQRKWYTNMSASVVDVEEELGASALDELERELALAAACSQSGYESSDCVRGGAVCYTSATLLGAITRSTGILARAVNAGSHAVTEAYLPTPPDGALFPDADRWFVFDATDHKSNMAGPFAVGSDPNVQPSYHFWNLWGAVAPRGQYCLAEKLAAQVQGGIERCSWITTSVDWEAPTNRGSFQIPSSGVKDLAPEYNSSTGYWITKSGVTGWLSFGDKDVYRISKSTAGGDYLRVVAQPSFGSSNLAPELCIYPSPLVSGATSSKRCADAASVRRIPEGESYVVVFNDSENMTRYHGDVTRYRIEVGDGSGWARCDDATLNGQELAVDCGGNCPGCAVGQPCKLHSDCQSFVCDSATGKCAPPPCSAETAIDLGPPGKETVVPSDGCVKVESEYPAWWGTRTMSLVGSGGASYPIPLAWANDCSGGAGQSALTSNWQSLLLSPTSRDCPTVIDLRGDGTGKVTLRYYGQ